MDQLDNSETPMAADAKQPSLFPEEEGTGQGPALAQQLASMSPDDLAAMAAALDPDIKATLVQAIFSSMSPEEKAAVDNTPGGDVNNAMAGATPERPEQQYQMSVIRAHKVCESTPGMGTLANSELDKWHGRIEALRKEGFLSDEEAKGYMDKFSKTGENRFSILLDSRGLLRDATLEIEALERFRDGQPKLATGVLQQRFGITKPALPPRSVRDDSEDFNREEAEKAGSRLANYR